MIITVITVILTPSSLALSPDEQAVEHLNQGLLPPEVNSSIKPQPGLFDFIGKLFSLLGFTPQKPEQLHPAAKLEHQSQLPEAVRPKPTNILEEIATQIPQFLGQKGKVGIYQPNIPPEVQDKASQTKDFEKLYQQSNFPEGIAPITGK